MLNSAALPVPRCDPFQARMRRSAVLCHQPELATLRLARTRNPPSKQVVSVLVLPFYKTREFLLEQLALHHPQHGRARAVDVEDMPAIVQSKIGGRRQII